MEYEYPKNIYQSQDVKERELPSQQNLPEEPHGEM